MKTLLILSLLLCGACSPGFYYGMGASMNCSSRGGHLVWFRDYYGNAYLRCER